MPDVALAAHWAVDRRSAPALARHLGLARRRPGWPWRDVWAAEGVAPGPDQHALLRAPMLDAEGVAALIPTASGAARSAKTVVRWSESARDGFPAALRLGPRLRRWREAEILAWLAEDPAPFERTPPRAVPGPAARTRKAASQSAAPSTARAPAAPAARPFLKARAPSCAARNDTIPAMARIAGHNDGERTK